MGTARRVLLAMLAASLVVLGLLTVPISAAAADYTVAWRGNTAAATLPADSAVWRAGAGRPNRAWLICERPALWRQTNRTWVIARSAVGVGFH